MNSFKCDRAIKNGKLDILKEELALDPDGYKYSGHTFFQQAIEANNFKALLHLFAGKHDVLYGQGDPLVMVTAVRLMGRDVFEINPDIFYYQLARVDSVKIYKLLQVFGYELKAKRFLALCLDNDAYNLMLHMLGNGVISAEDLADCNLQLASFEMLTLIRTKINLEISSKDVKSTDSRYEKLTKVNRFSYQYLYSILGAKNADHLMLLDVSSKIHPELSQEEINALVVKSMQEPEHTCILYNNGYRHNTSSQVLEELQFSLNSDDAQELVKLFPCLTTEIKLFLEDSSNRIRFLIKAKPSSIACAIEFGVLDKTKDLALEILNLPVEGNNIITNYLMLHDAGLKIEDISLKEIKSKIGRSRLENIHKHIVSQKIS